MEECLYDFLVRSSKKLHGFLKEFTKKLMKTCLEQFLQKRHVNFPKEILGKFVAKNQGVIPEAAHGVFSILEKFLKE